MGSVLGCTWVCTSWFPQPIAQEAELIQPTAISSGDVAAALEMHEFCFGFFFPAGKVANLAQCFLYCSLAFDVSNCNGVFKALPFPQMQ